MEGQTQFQTALKKSVLMFNTLTGKGLTEEEGSIFINLLDMAEAYHSAVTHVTTEVKPADKWPPELVKELAKGDPRNNMAPQHKNAGIDAALNEIWAAQPIRNASREHIQGYDWQIVVLSREKDPSDSYVIHFAYKPTQSQFEEHFVKFIARTHYVHANEWNRTLHGWEGITNVYEVAPTLHHKHDHNPRWEQDDMAYRIRYYDRETGELSFKYVPRKPSGNELATYHHTKGFATVQSKVA